MHSRVAEIGGDFELVINKYIIYKRIKKCRKWAEVVNSKRQKAKGWPFPNLWCCSTCFSCIRPSVCPSPACEMGFGGLGLAGLYSDVFHVFHVFLPYVLVFLSITDIRKDGLGG
jgi:hypothetical protein